MGEENDRPRADEPRPLSSESVSDWFRPLLGAWDVHARSVLVETARVGRARGTRHSPSAAVSGTAAYKDITFGTAMHGEYRLGVEDEARGLAVLVQQSGVGGIVSATAASPHGRFSGTVILTGTSLLFEGPGTSPVRHDESEASSVGVFQTAYLAVHPLRDDVWVLVTYHVYRASEVFTLKKTVIWHARRVDVGAETTVSEPPGDWAVTPEPTRAVALEDRLAALVLELADRHREFGEATERAEEVETELESAEDDALEAEFAQCGCLVPCGPGEDTLVPPPLLTPETAAQVRAGYLAIFDALTRLHELRDECENLSSEIDALELGVGDVEGLLERGYSEWVEERVRGAEEVLARTPHRPADWLGLMPDEAVAALSEDAKTILGTVPALYEFYSNADGMRDKDWGPVVACMAKGCERVLADFLEPKCRSILADPSLCELYSRTNYTEQIPADDREYVDDGSLRRVVKDVMKSERVGWSGTRNAGIALLLFGSRMTLGPAPGRVMDNPLGLFGTEAVRAALRCDLYRLQQLRNAVVHRDTADQEQTDGVMRCFRRCLHALGCVLYGVGCGEVG